MIDLTSIDIAYTASIVAGYVVQVVILVLYLAFRYRLYYRIGIVFTNLLAIMSIALSFLLIVLPVSTNGVVNVVLNNGTVVSYVLPHTYSLVTVLKSRQAVMWGLTIFAICAICATWLYDIFTFRRL